jgi:transcriptional regulator with XRE-family HTH domain
MLVTRAIHELQVAREDRNVSLAQLAAATGSSESALSRFERLELEDVGVIRLSEIASVLGYEISLGIHPVGDPLRDRAQLAIGGRFDACLGPAWIVLNEVLLPEPGDRRSWDKVVQLAASDPPYAIGVDIESRIRDVQTLTRRTRERETDHRIQHILLALADTATNRRLVGQLVENLGDPYRTPMREIRRSLKRAEKLPGSGVLLV